MRLASATTLTVAVLALSTSLVGAGCGSISMVSDDGGSSGDAGKGAAGSTGVGGRGGAGPAGQAGSSGGAGATGVAGAGSGVAGSTGVAGAGAAGRGGATGVAGSTGVAGAGAAGRGGTTGLAGSTGVAGTPLAGSTGIAGAGAAGRGGTTGLAGAGPGGSSGAGGSGPGSPFCPVKVPPDGATCLFEGLLCEYGNDPRGDKCRTILACSDQRWKYTNKPECPAIEYPECRTRPGEVCDQVNTYCYQSDGAACGCSTCPPNMICLPGSKPYLYCTMPSSHGCPAGLPNLGTPCEIEKLSCDYCPDNPRTCYGGIWIPGKPTACPVAAN